MDGGFRLHIVSEQISMESLSALVERTQAGEVEAENELHRRLRPYVHQLARSRDFVPNSGNGDADASDVTQATLLRVAKSIPDYRGLLDPQLKAWIRRILQNQAIDYHRRRSPTVSLDQSGTNGRLRNQLAPDDSTPSRRAIRTEESTLLLMALEKLPHDQQKAVRFRYLDGLPVKEIAKRLGNRTEGAAAQLIRRGIARLNSLLAHRM